MVCRALACSLVIAILIASAERAQAQTYDPDGQKLVGRIHDANRAARKRQQLSISSDLDEVHVRYAKAKKEIEEATGVTYSMESSVMSQWGAPNGGYGAVQAMFTPAVNWDMFSSPRFGDGSLQFHFLATQYLSGNDGTAIANNIGILSPINNQPTANNQFVQVTYTHSFPGDWLAVSVGQYALSNFDTNAYANDQQVNFIGYSLTQNGSQNYAQAGIGAYAQVNPTKEITFAAGFQDNNDLSGSYVQFSTLGNGQYAWFGYGAWSPTVGTWGQGTYSLLYYNLPSVPIQPRAGDGLSFNAAQPIGDKWGLFLRANTAWNSSFPIQSSIGGGAVLNDPLQRSPHDQIGLAMVWNATNMSLYQNTFVRPSETMLEFYWTWTAYHTLLVTPNLQLFLQPALTPTDNLAAVFTIRLTQLF